MRVLLLILNLFFVELLYGGGIGKIKFLTYEDNSDCSGLYHDTCDFKFKPLRIEDENGNILFKIPRTTSTSNTTTVDLTEVEELKNPIEIQVPTNKTVKIVTTVWDEDSPSEGKKIREVTDFVVPFDATLAGSDWKQAIITSSNPDMIFTVEYKLEECDVNYTEQGCNFCKPNCFTESCDKCCMPVAGQYTCTDQGDKVCEGNWNGTDCDSCMSYFYGTECSKYCQETADHTCDESGDKVCKDNYYPDQVCFTYCLPKDGFYTCNSTTGDRVCLGNRAGEYCTGCVEHYFGNECLTYCEANGNYMCSDSGHKICLDNTTSVANYCIQGRNVTLQAAWSLAAIFFLSTVLITVFAARKILDKTYTPYITNLESEDEYADNIIIRAESSAGLAEENLYNNKELYEL